MQTYDIAKAVCEVDRLAVLFPYSLQNFAIYHNLPSGNNSSQGLQLLSELLYLYQQYNEARCQGRDSRDNQIPVLSLLPASGAPPDPQRPFHNPASVGGHQREDHRLLANWLDYTDRDTR